MVYGEGEEDEDGATGKGAPVSDNTMVTTRKSHPRLMALREGFRLSSASRTESMLLLSAWLVYFIYNVSAFGKGATWS